MKKQAPFALPIYTRPGMSDTSSTEIVAADGSFLCDAFNAKEAAFIKTACNSHAALVEALEGFGITRAGVLAVLQSHAAPSNMTNDIMEMLWALEKRVDAALKLTQE